MAAWYAVRCPEGNERELRDRLLARIKELGLTDRILNIVVPAQRETEIRAGQKRVVGERTAGCLLVEMILDDVTDLCVRQTDGVDRFESGDGMNIEEVNRFISKLFGDDGKFGIKIDWNFK